MVTILTQKVFIAGCGYIGERLACSYKESGADLTCIVRSSEHAARLESIGLHTVVTALDDLDTIPLITPGNSILFYLVPPPGGGVVDSRARNFIAQMSAAEAPSKIVYMSATSVYSNADGDVVTEESTATPDTAMGKRRLDAESAFLDYGATRNVPVVILRVSGIYGPGRLPLMQISQGHPLLNEQESGPSNRIHADDLTSICIAAAQKGAGGDIFNISEVNHRA